MQVAGIVCSCCTSRVRWSCSPCIGIQEVERKATATGQGLGIRRVQTSVWLGPAPPRQPTHVDVFGRPDSRDSYISAKSVFVLSPKSWNRRMYSFFLFALLLILYQTTD